jgi:N-acetylglucosamine kinase-like BadF-type ATPase
MTRRVLGVDGGGTHTRAAIIDETGQLLGWGKAGPSNYDDVGIELAQSNIARAVNSASQTAGIAADQLTSVFFGMAGVVSENDRQIILQIAHNLHLAPPNAIGVDHDCRIALAGGLGGRPGIVLITGTGSSCYGRNAQSQDWRAGGWAHLIADEGSSYWFGLQAMRAAVRGFDGRGRPTLLYDAVMHEIELADINEIMHRLYHIGMSRAEVAALAPIVFAAARQGDQVAQRIIELGIHELVLAIHAVATRLGLLPSPEIVLVGGLQKVKANFATPLRTAIQERLPGSKVHSPDLSPVLGASLLALEQIDIDSGALSSKLQASAAQHSSDIENLF